MSLNLVRLFFFFFFQAEDGIRDHCVTGVQTCALPIFDVDDSAALRAYATRLMLPENAPAVAAVLLAIVQGFVAKIGRASCRERVYISVVAVVINKKINSARMIRHRGALGMSLV